MIHERIESVESRSPRQVPATWGGAVHFLKGFIIRADKEPKHIWNMLNGMNKKESVK